MKPTKHWVFLCLFLCTACYPVVLDLPEEGLVESPTSRILQISTSYPPSNSVMPGNPYPIIQSSPTIIIPTSTLTPTAGWTASDEFMALLAHYLTPVLSATPYPTDTPKPALPPSPTSSGVQEVLGKIQVRSLPPNWIATLPPMEPLPGMTGTQVFLQAATDLMNYVQGEEQAYLKILSILNPDNNQVPGRAWLRAADLDSDGALEWLMAYPVEAYGTTIKCSGSCVRLVILFEKQGAQFVPVSLMDAYTDHQDGAGWYNFPLIFGLDDLNLDGHLEVLLHTRQPANHADFENLIVTAWDGARWQELGYFSQRSVEQMFAVDLDGDGLKEIILNGGMAGVTWISPERTQLSVYGLRDGSYEWSGDFLPASGHAYFQVLDANAALQAGRLAKALELAKNAWLPSYAHNWRLLSCQYTYAAIQVMLVYALWGEQSNLQAVLDQIEQRCGASGDRFVGAARLFSLAYRQTGDVLAACQAMERFVADRWSDPRAVPALLPPFRIYQDQFPLEEFETWQVCSLDIPARPSAAKPADAIFLGPVMQRFRTDNEHDVMRSALAINNRLLVQTHDLSTSVYLPLQEYLVKSAITSLDWFPDGQHLVYSVKNAGELHILNIMTGGDWLIGGKDKRLYAPSVSPTGFYIAALALPDELSLSQEACRPPRGLAILGLDASLQFNKTLRLEDFQGLPADEVIFPALDQISGDLHNRLVWWKDNTRLQMILQVGCAARQKLTVYELDVSTLSAHLVIEDIMQPQLGFGGEP